VPLPDRAYKVGLERIKSMKKGTAFGGTAEVGVKIDELLAREPKL
jgi:phosphate transport system substrate-binding protein